MRRIIPAYELRWYERCRQIQRRLFPSFGRQLATVHPIKPIAARVDHQLEAMVAGEIPGAVVDRPRMKRRR
jgi:hypothetical protein